MSNSWKPPPSLNRGEHGLEFFVLTNDLTTLEVKDVLGKMSLFLETLITRQLRKENMY